MRRNYDVLYSLYYYFIHYTYIIDKMNIFTLFFIIMAILFIPVLIKVMRQYNNMINEKFTYLKSRISNLENEFKKSKNGKKKKKIV